jgi:hypothetical protein
MLLIHKVYGWFWNHYNFSADYTQQAEKVPELPDPDNLAAVFENAERRCAGFAKVNNHLRRMKQSITSPNKSCAPHSVCRDKGVLPDLIFLIVAIFAKSIGCGRNVVHCSLLE